MKILIADDESIIRLGLKTILEDMGHDVQAARDGSEALQLAREIAFEVAILDIRMPKTNGLQAAKAMYKARPLPIVMLTAHSDPELIEEAADLPIHGYLVKPIEPNQLSAAITIAVKRFNDLQASTQQTHKLRLTLEARKLLDKAKGKLMAQGMTEAAAHKYIQTRARDERVSVVAVVQEILKD